MHNTLKSSDNCVVRVQDTHRSQEDMSKMNDEHQKGEQGLLHIQIQFMDGNLST